MNGYVVSNESHGDGWRIWEGNICSLFETVQRG